LIKLDRIEDAKGVFAQSQSKGLQGEGFDQLDKRINATDTKKPNSQDPSQEQLQTIIDLYSKSQFQEVLNQASHLLLEYPRSVVLHNIAGASHKGLGELEKAVEVYTKAISLKPDHAETYNNMGNALREQEKLEEATEAYKKALSVKPDYAEAYYNMGVTFKDQGKLEEAIMVYTKALSIKPDYAEACNNMGNALREQEKLEEATEAYKKAISLKPDYAEAYNNLGHVHMVVENFEQARTCFKEALRINPIQNKLGLSLALQGLGRYEEAIAAVVWKVNKPAEFQINLAKEV
jgi:tetratricopeptide (TPR) repeat protein